MLAILHKKDRSEILLETLKRFVKKGNWSNDRFDKLNDLLLEVGQELQNGTIQNSDILEISTCFDKNFLAETLQGHGLRKPYGYPGDFMLLDKIYTGYKTRNTRYRIWDDYFQKQSAPCAVRNRKEYFKKFMTSKSAENSNLKLLNVVSGPGRELLEMYMNLPNGKSVQTTCVEIDDYAIAYSRGLNTDYLDSLEFVHSNIFRYENSQKFDVIWTAGLFDYMNDRAFLLLLSRFKNWLLPGGEIIVGNFNLDNNPSRNYMEIMGDWHLIHRTEKQLKELAKEAGFLNSQIKVGQEKLAVNLFLHLKIE
ncbi:class I SAM-dependent methyltransferase [Aurantibacter crassamenti]|uniref:class I SAM-dependent methyltransferase n=1 Tax=Aurantibacter crassamenti TaxID=1837375 RepID=UPI00193A2F6C|nr:class I SAM-dependent methyltransferase [Aurantibacter crassamenti]MBM1105391.1 class I SAM-dependent methyltransferase [Aurantibacter crassamenti]